MSTIRPRMAGERRETAVKLITAGATDADVARQLGAVRKTIQRLRREIGVAPVDAATASRKGTEWRKSKWGPNRLRPSERRVLDVLSNGSMTVEEVMRARRGGGYRPTHQILVRLRKMGMAFCEGGPSPKLAYWQTLWWWLRQNDGMVWTVAKRVAKRSPHLVLEDIASQVRIEVSNCVPSFRPRGWKFSTYALPVAEMSCRQWACAEKARGVRFPYNLQMKAHTLVQVGRMENRVGEERSDVRRTTDDGREPPPMDPDFWDRAVEGLDPRLAAVVLGHFRDGKLYRELGPELGVSRGRIEQLVRKAEVLIRRNKTLDQYVA